MYAPLFIQFPIMEELKKGLNAMQFLWENSGHARAGRDNELDGIFGFEADVRDVIKKGEYTIFESARPDWTNDPNNDFEVSFEL